MKEVEKRDSLGELARGVIERYPDPPREVALQPLASAVLLRSSTLPVLVLAAGALAAAGVVFRGFASGGELLGVILFGGGLAALGVLGILAPVRTIRRYLFALRHGVVADAIVQSVTLVEPGVQFTLDTIQNGFARGKRQVRYLDRVFVEDFESDDPWAMELAEGVRLKLLVHPETDTSLVELGPADRYDH